MNIFICYRREDSADVSGRIHDRLGERFGRASVFKDVDSIPLGVDFRRHIERAVGGCAVLLAVIGPRWLEIPRPDGGARIQDARDFVHLEVHTALQRDIPVIPLLVGGAQMPTEQELPAALRSLHFRNGIRIRPDPDFHRDVDRLVKAIEEVHPAGAATTVPKRRAGPQPARRPHPVRRPPARPSRRFLAAWMLPLLGTLATALALTGVWFWLSDGAAAPEPASTSGRGGTVRIEEPEADALLASRRLTVRGAADPGVLAVWLRGRRIPVTNGAFEAPLEVERDGPIEILLTTEDGADLARRTVHVDATPPVLEIEEPAGERTVSAAREILVRGRVLDANPSRLETGDFTVPLSGDDFRFEVNLPEGGERALELMAWDAAGNRSQPIHLELVHRVPREPWEVLLAEFEKAMLREDYVKARTCLDLAREQGADAERVQARLVERLRAWEAPPQLTVEHPTNRQEVPGEQVEVRGHLETGRGTDCIWIDGTEVRRTPLGRFHHVVFGVSGSSEPIEIVVRDNTSGAERARVERWVTWGAGDFPPAWEGDPVPAAAPTADRMGEPYTVGDQIPDLVLTAVDGSTYRLSDLDATSEDALLSVLETASVQGQADPEPTLALGDVRGLSLPDGSLDSAAVQAFCDRAGEPYGLLVDPDRAASFRTLQDVADWIAGASGSPIVLTPWSPTCVVSLDLADDIRRAVSRAGVRFIALTGKFKDISERNSDPRDSVQDMVVFVRSGGPPFLVGVDPRHTVSDQFGCTVTCEFLVLDEDRMLRYHGPIDARVDSANPPSSPLYLTDALAALQQGEEVETPYVKWERG